jgi:Fe-S oxidoreductase
MDLSDPSDRAKLESLAEAVYEVVWDLNGTISGEHGCGLVRTQFLRRQYGDLFPLFQRIKEVFDPQNVFNPGKVIGEDPHLMTRDLLRLPGVLVNGAIEDDPVEDAVEVPHRTAPPNPPPVLRWEGPGPVLESARCNGCGACRTLEPSLRMCPTFRAFRGEAAAPRAKAGLLRQVATGLVDPREWGSDEARELADLCVHCDLCRIECPAGVDVSSLMLEAKASHVEQHGLPLTEWMLSRIDVWSAWASRFPRLFNGLMANRTVRWVLERSFGLSRLRRLPQAGRGSFLRRAERLGLTRPQPHRPGPRVAYFVDLYANHFDQELAESVVAVLIHAGVNVYVPRAQAGSGMAALVAGDVDHARELIAKNLRTLSTAVRDGYTIVCSEPTAALMLRRECLKLTDDLDADIVAENTRDVGHYLAGLEGRGHLPPRDHAVRLRVGYHQPCHLRALEVGTPGLDLVRTIPGVEADWLDLGCSGMAGTYGLSRRNFRNSLRAGRALFRGLRDPEIRLGMTECGACQLQMEQGAHKTTIHPVKLLALSFGLNPALRRHLSHGGDPA